jgi:hypothetical protein
MCRTHAVEAKYSGKECQRSAQQNPKDEDEFEDTENVRGGSDDGNDDNDTDGVRQRERLMATTESAIDALTTVLEFQLIEGAHQPEGPGWGRAFYEPSPFDSAPGPAPRPVVHVGQEAAAMGRQYVETIPGGMMPIIDPAAPPTSVPTPTTNTSRPTPSLPNTPAPASSPILIPDHGQVDGSHDNDGSTATS